MGDKPNPEADQYIDDTLSSDDETEVWKPSKLMNHFWTVGFVFTLVALYDLNWTNTVKNFSFLFVDNSVPEEFTVDYDLIIENVKELNILAGEGISKIQHTVDGARLKVRHFQWISLLYAILVLKAHYGFRKEILAYLTNV